MDYYGDFIIPCYLQSEDSNDFEYRLRNIKIICDLLPKNMNIIIVEQTNKNQEKKYITELQRLNLFRKDIDYIEKQYDGDFVKGWLYNIGYRHAKTDNLFLAETDVVFSPTYWIDIYKQLNENNYKWAHCWNNLYVISENGEEIKHTHTIYAGGPEGGIVYVNKDFYKNIGGSNEWMLGLGGMDNEFIVRCEYHTNKRYMLKGEIYHLWHPFSFMKGTARSEESIKYKHNRRKNTDIVHRARSNKKIYCSEISKYSEEIGGEAPLCEKIIMFDETGKKLISQLRDNTTEEDSEVKMEIYADPISVQQSPPPSPKKVSNIKKLSNAAPPQKITKKLIIKNAAGYKFNIGAGK